MTDKELYETCYDIMVKHALISNNPDDKAYFVYCFTNPNDSIYEYRVGGTLGFGGKFWRNDGKLYVSCYSEDLTPTRKKIIEQINKEFVKLIPPEGVWGPDR